MQKINIQLNYKKICEYTRVASEYTRVARDVSVPSLFENPEVHLPSIPQTYLILTQTYLSNEMRLPQSII